MKTTGIQQIVQASLTEGATADAVRRQVCLHGAATSALPQVKAVSMQDAGPAAADRGRTFADAKATPAWTERSIATAAGSVPLGAVV